MLGERDQRLILLRHRVDVLDALELAGERDLVAHHGDADVAHALLVQVDERAPVDLVVREGLRVILWKNKRSVMSDTATKVHKAIA